MDFKRKNIRLKEFEYGRGYAYFITINTCEKKNFFENTVLATLIQNELILRDSKGEINLICYCVMSNHIHLLFFLGEGYDKSLSVWVSSFKRYTSKLAKEISGMDKLWQINFYDHVVRKDESLSNIAEYIYITQ